MVLLDCYLKAIPLYRAIWFIRIIGVTEMTSPRTIGIHHSFTVKWTSIFISFLYSKLALVPTITSDSHAEIKSGHALYLIGWNYCAELSKRLYNEGLLDQRIFLSKLLDMFLNAIHQHVRYIQSNLGDLSGPNTGTLLTGDFQVSNVDDSATGTGNQ